MKAHGSTAQILTMHIFNHKEHHCTIRILKIKIIFTSNASEDTEQLDHSHTATENLNLQIQIYYKSKLSAYLS